MRNFDLLDTNSFRAFWAASEFLNFTLAAKKSGLTQSGVSQHIFKLEEQLGVPLFQRMNKKVFLTESGVLLRKYIDQHLDQLEAFKELVGSQYSAIEGSVAYAMPESCLKSPHLALLLAERSKNFPRLKLQLTLCPTEEAFEKLAKNEIDFCFATSKTNIGGIRLRPFCYETYVLVGSEKSLLKNLNVENLIDRPFVNYPGAHTLYQHLSQVYFTRRKPPAWESLSMAGHINSLSGGIAMAQNGVGLTVVPEHCVNQQLNSKSLFRLAAPGGIEAKNQIYIATRDSDHTPRRVEKVIESFMAMSKN